MFGTLKRFQLQGKGNYKPRMGTLETFTGILQMAVSFPEQCDQSHNSWFTQQHIPLTGCLDKALDRKPMSTFSTELSLDDYEEKIVHFCEDGI